MKNLRNFCYHSFIQPNLVPPFTCDQITKPEMCKLMSNYFSDRLFITTSVGVVREQKSRLSVRNYTPNIEI